MIDEHIRLTKEHYTQAFSEPSFDYILVYIKVAIAMGLIIYALWYCFLKKDKPNMMVGFDDIGHTTKVVDDSDDDRKKENYGSSRSGGKARDTTASTAKDKAKAQDVGEYRSVSLKKEID